jgi:hypothetical protein
LLCGSLAILLVNLFVFGYPPTWAKPNLNAALMDMSEWFKTNSVPASSYVFLSDDHNLAEWMPFLTNRTTLVGHWGSEWNNTYDRDLAIFDRVGQCSRQESLDCLDTVFGNNKLNPAYLISLRSQAKLNNQLLKSRKWQQVFENDQFVVYMDRSL